MRDDDALDAFLYSTSGFLPKFGIVKIMICPQALPARSHVDSDRHGTCEIIQLDAFR